MRLHPERTRPLCCDTPATVICFWYRLVPLCDVRAPGTRRRCAYAQTVFAAVGVSTVLAPAQIQNLDGPMAEAARTGESVVTADVWADPRWPSLTLDAVTAYEPACAASWPAVRGVAAHPAVCHDGRFLVVGCALDRPATAGTLDVLARYEDIVTLTLAIVEDGHQGKALEIMELVPPAAPRTSPSPRSPRRHSEPGQVLLGMVSPVVASRGFPSGAGPARPRGVGRCRPSPAGGPWPGPR